MNELYFADCPLLALACSVCMCLIMNIYFLDFFHPLAFFGWSPWSPSSLFSVLKMISEANVGQVHQHNYYIALLYCKTDLELLRNSTGVILVGM